MTLLLALFCSVGFGGELHPGMVQPSAVPIEAGSGYVSAGGAAGVVIFAGGIGVGTVQGTIAPTDRLAVDASFLSVHSQGEHGVAGMVGARYLVVDHERFHLAPVVTMLGGSGGGIGATGIAIEAGSERVRFDATLPVVGLSVEPGFPVEPILTVAEIEAGVTFRIGAEHRDRIRLGAVGPIPTVTYRHAADRWFVDASLGSLLIVNFVQGDIGVRF